MTRTRTTQTTTTDGHDFVVSSSIMTSCLVRLLILLLQVPERTREDLGEEESVATIFSSTEAASPLRHSAVLWRRIMLVAIECHECRCQNTVSRLNCPSSPQQCLVEELISTWPFSYYQ